MNSLPGIILRSKCKCRKSGKALRKLLPTWLALMNSSQRLRQIPKQRIASMWLRWLITLLNVFLLFFSLSFLRPPSTSSNHWRCVQNPCCCLFESVLWIGVRHKLGEPTCNQYTCSGVKTMHWLKVGMYKGAGGKTDAWMLNRMKVWPISLEKKH